MFDIGPTDYGKALAVGLIGYVVLVAMAGVVALLMIRFIDRRVSTFMLLTFGMFTEFMIIFYGINLGIPYFTDFETVVGEAGLFAISLILAIPALLITAFYLRWILTPEVSPYEREAEALTDEELAQFDINRREYMKKRKEITGRGKGI